MGGWRAGVRPTLSCCAFSAKTAETAAIPPCLVQTAVVSVVEVLLVSSEAVHAVEMVIDCLRSQHFMKCALNVLAEILMLGFSRSCTFAACMRASRDQDCAKSHLYDAQRHWVMRQRLTHAARQAFDLTAARSSILWVGHGNFSVLTDHSMTVLA
jgi:hypothetical protein